MSCRKDDELSEEDLGSEGWQQAGSEESYGKLTEPAVTAPLEHSPQEHQLSGEEFGELKWPQAGAEESDEKHTEPETVVELEDQFVEFGGSFVEYGGVERKKAGSEESCGKLTEPSGSRQVDKRGKLTELSVQPSGGSVFRKVGNNA